jgi:signal transduction histidine kinase
LADQEKPAAKRPLGLRWPRASLRTYLVGVILAATVPLALLVAYQTIRESRHATTRDASHGDDDGHDALIALGLAGACLLIGATAAMLVARRVTEPVALLARGVPGSKVGLVVVDEIAALRDAIEEVSAERRLATERLAKKAQEAESASRAKDEFLAMLGHELRNPMNAIVTSVEVLGHIGVDAPAASSARAVIARQTRKLARMTEELLDVGRLLADDAELLCQPLQLAQLVQRRVDAARDASAAKRQSLHASLAEVWVHADAQRIAQIVDRLLDNAIKYSPIGASIDFTLEVDPARRALAMLRVADTGPGIAPELLPRIFEPFSQGPRGLDRREGGLGIGLTVVRRVVELHGGCIGVRNRRADEASPDGAVFELCLPVIEAPRTVDAGSGETPVTGRPVRLANARVAVIDDNTDALSGLRSMLELDGHAVQTAADGEAGLALLLRQSPEIAIVDIGLPGIDGYEVARRSRAEGFRGRLIALSGYGQAQDLQRSRAAGFDAHLVKPVEPAQLQRILAGA